MQTNSQFLAEFCWIVEWSEFLQYTHISRGKHYIGSSMYQKILLLICVLLWQNFIYIYIYILLKETNIVCFLNFLKNKLIIEEALNVIFLVKASSI